MRIDELWKVGDVVENEYEVLQILGGPQKSSMGIVYVLRNKGTRYIEAAKTYQLLIESDSVELRQRFEREAQIWNRLAGHPNIVEPRGVLHFVGLPFIMSEFVDGGDLGHAIRQGAFVDALERVCDIGMQFCDGMAFALDHGVRAHLDIKPSNLLLSDNRYLRICDFGIARTLDGASKSDDSADNTSSCELLLISTPGGVIAGSPLYLAPEQWEDPESVDHRTDIYSFGLVLYEMLTGCPPPRDRLTDFLSLTPIQNGKMRSIIGKCLQKRKEDRFMTFADLREALGVVYTSKTGRAPHKGIFRVPADCLIQRDDGIYGSDHKWEHDKLMQRVELLIEEEDSDSLRKLIPVIQRQLQRQPTSPELCIAIARAYETLDEEDKALPYYETASKYGRNGIARGFAAAQVGLIWYRKFNIASAIIAFKTTIEEDPDYYYGHYALGRCLIARKEFELARESLRTSIRLNPDDEDSYVCLARCLTRTSGQFDDAIAMLTKASQRIPRSKTIARCLAASMLLNNQVNDSANMVDDALAFSPEYIELHLMKVASSLLQKDLAGALEQENTAFSFKQTASVATLIEWRGCTSAAQNDEWETCLAMIHEWLQKIAFKVEDEEFNPFFRINHAHKV
jgi:serine/threonine protein kinase